MPSSEGFRCGEDFTEACRAFDNVLKATWATLFVARVLILGIGPAMPGLRVMGRILEVENDFALDRNLPRSRSTALRRRLDFFTS